MQHKVFKIVSKEVSAFFTSAMAYIFLAAFLLVNLFLFFWVETFFSRNIADVRPLFEWMPVLMIFLTASLTMRLWSDEKRMGTQELLLTYPVSCLQLVLAKFIACMILVFIALCLTLPLVISVSQFGQLDWGPVLGAYLASLLLAAAYIAIGLAVSAKTDNQIVSLLISILICTFIYLLGSPAVTSLFDNETAEYFQLFASGARFKAITRGVIDLKDLYYYLSIVAVFLSLNVFFLESSRWKNSNSVFSHRRWRLLTALFISNFIIANFWLNAVKHTRVDLTQGQIYSISDASLHYLKQLQEPLLIRGYFSNKTHPLLAPLVPQLRDLIEEFQTASESKIRAEFIDPLDHPELEQEAAENYGIRSVPFQVADKYQAALVNSYFHVLIRYGDQHEVLSFQDLIEVKAQSESDLNVALRNPEYEITRAIKQVLTTYQTAGNLFLNMKQPVSFKGYISAESQLPEKLAGFKQDVHHLLTELEQKSAGQLSFEFVDPSADEGQTAAFIQENYGFRPMQLGLFDSQRFYFYMLLENESQTQQFQIPLPEDLTKTAFKISLDETLKRFSSGFVKTVGLYTPAPVQSNPMMQSFNLPSGKQFSILKQTLSENHNVVPLDLSSGRIADQVDILLLVAANDLDQKQLFAIDQFLMKGGTVMIASGSFSSNLSAGNLSVSRHQSGLEDWLAFHGIRLTQSMILDPQNAMLPVPMERDLGGFKVQEIQMIEYPYFIDIRKNAMADSAMLAGIDQITLNWVSAIEVDENKNQSRSVETLLSSSNQSWSSDSTQVLPDYRLHSELGFAPVSEVQSFSLAKLIEGEFKSYFQGKDSPLIKRVEEDDNNNDTEAIDTVQVHSVIEKSAKSARIFLVGSNEFLSDETIQLAASSGGTMYLNSMQFIQNAIDWSLEDRALLTIRNRSHFSRTLFPIDENQQLFWEYINYFFAMTGIAFIYLLYKVYRTMRMKYLLMMLQNEDV